jgi:hypothetical protein
MVCIDGNETEIRADHAAALMANMPALSNGQRSLERFRSRPVLGFRLGCESSARAPSHRLFTLAL